MKKTMLFAVSGAVVLLALAGRAAVPLEAQAAAPAAAAKTEFFEQKVRPVLTESCVGCHGSTAMGGLQLDSKQGLLKGGDTGPAVVPGDPDKSLLISAVRQGGALKMPLGGARLSDQKIADLTAWVKDGAEWPDAQIGAKPESVLSDFFESNIRPVLAQQCFACHTNTKSGGLRLDSIKDLLKGGTSGPAVVPGDPDKSLLMQAMRHTGAVKMPKGGTRLDTHLDNFAMWIKDGAYWPADKTVVKQYTAAEKNIWSIQPLQKPAVPAVKDTAWPLTDIDRFVLAKLEKEGLKPATTADRRTLLRRVTYDVTGLMPTLDEVTAFESDKSPNAWEKVVDRLLASPRYGERWARHWMDVVRYGEDDYNVAQRPDRVERYPFAYLYRDWLIQALNEDMPYDMFVKTQLAADLMDPATRDKNLAALGMHGNGSWIFNSSPAAVERADEWHDKVDVTGKAFLGLTVGCARCHDHKYDAIYTRDYYQMASIFASSRFKAYPRVPKSVVNDYNKEAKILEKKNKTLTAFLDHASDLYAQTLFSQSESYMVAAWKLGKDKKATIVTIADDTKLDPEILERWVRFLKKKPDNYETLVPWQQMVASGGTEEQARKLARDFYDKVTAANEERNKLEKENEFLVAQVNGTTEEQACATCMEENPKQPFDPLPNDKKRPLNRYQVDLKALDREELLLWRDVFDRDVPGATEEVDENRRVPGLLKLTNGALERRLSPDLKAHVDRLRADIDAFKKSMPPQYPFIYGLEEAKEPSDLKVFVRGNPAAFGEDAPRGFPSIFTGGEPKLFTKGSGRMELAEEILRQPIASRVMVNRLWTWHMGRGIVDSPSNFGVVGERPSNPELLDYLATKFLADGRSWKTLHKDILMSRTYQLAVTPVAANGGKDPENRLFAHANRRRLEAEGVWDSLLQTGGSLDTVATGGPSHALDTKMNRRGVYATVSRLYPGDFQVIFDLPTATISAEKRYVTNVPQQRLFFLNNPVVRTQAEAIVERIRSAGNNEAQVKKAFEIVYQREPSGDEIKGALEFLQLPPVAPPALAEGGKEEKDDKDGKDGKDAKDEPKKLPPSSLRSFVWALLSSNEFMYLD